ncbi:MAG TPA: hypothetical protein PKG49_04795 [Nitrosomonas mobilis]|nr:hypothetical protein [Nitrosomonas mobilis]
MGGDIALLVDTGLCGGEICAPNDGVINVQVMKVAKIAMCAIRFLRMLRSIIIVILLN